MCNSEELSIDGAFYTKIEIAEHQLNQSLQLFLVDKDYISAITLAGASEEILGKLLEARNIENALENWVDTTLGFAKIFGVSELNRKQVISDANYSRDSLKHIKDGDSVLVTKNDAIQILERAIQNYIQLTGHFSSNIIEFYKVINE